MLRYSYILICLFCMVFGLTAQKSTYTENSALSQEGKWVKIELEENGIYKLTHADLSRMGFSDPSRVSVYGYGGWMLNEDLSDYIDDLPQVPVVKGTDYILFYGRGVTKWEYNERQQRFFHTHNPYSTKAYYFLSDIEAPREMTSVVDQPNNAAQIINSFDDYRLHEQDLLSVNKSGRELYGESFRSSPLTVSFNSLTGITNEKAIISMRYIALPSGSEGRATLKVGGKDLFVLPVTTGGIDSYTKAKAADGFKEISDEDKKETISVSVSYNNSSHSRVNLDYIRLEMKRELKPYGAFTLFRSVKSMYNPSRFVVKDANASTQIWDVTDPVNPSLMETNLNGSDLSFTIPASPTLREFAIVQPDKAGFPTPTKEGDVALQNLHALPQTDMIIISHSFMKTEAERLADAHRERDGLSVEVVDPIAIYNEFSSGTPDATAYRRFMKMFYDRASADGEKPKYLLLFGDGLYDNRGIEAEIKGSYPPDKIHKQFLLTYQSVNSLNIRSYVTDDYFGFLNDENLFGSATNIDNVIYSWKMDIGIGRLPLRTVNEARAAVDKLIGYMDNKQVGTWKNALAFVADDGNSADGFTVKHMSQANQLADYVEANHPEFISNKILFDAYKKESGGMTSYSGVRKRIEQLLKSGLLLINYTGHGDTQSWSDEKVITQNDIATSNYSCLPLWITATCDFTRFDDLATSAGEQVFLNTISGGIGLFTTTRVVYSNPNFELNKELIRCLFEKTDGKRPRLGDVMRQTKNHRNMNNDANKLNFILLGDPALRLAYPDYDMKVTSVNGKPVGDELIPFRALEEITIEGEVLTPEGTRATSFNGVVNATVFDSKVEKVTLGNNDKDSILEYTEYPNTLFIGNDKVENGVFRFTFMPPKDISYSNEVGKMNLYAHDEESGIEAQGNFNRYIVGGTNPNPVEDTEGPEIRCYYLNDSSFISGDKVNSTPLFVAEIWDKSGVNISGSSIGHDVTLIIDGNSALTYNLNTYYLNIPDKKGEGRVVFSIPALSAGLHTAEFIIWDIHNNSSRESFTFEVADDVKPDLIDVYATPNPAREQVEFRLAHNRPETMMNVSIMVYDMAGRLKWQGRKQGSSELFKDYIFTWDLTNSNGGRLLPGVYVFRAAVKTNYSKEATKGNKLIILAQ